MKKILSVALSTAMAFSMFASVAFGADANLTPQQKFDVLKQANIMDGMPDGSSALEKTLTRAELAKIIVKSIGLEPVTGVATYKDKNYTVNHWAAPFIEAATQAGILNGKDEAKQLFDPTGNVTVQELAKVLVAALKLEVPAEANNNASEWAKGYVAAAVKEGFLPEGINYQANATRSQAIVAAYAIYEANQVPTVASYKVVDPKNVEFTMSDDEVVKVTLETALEANKETEVKFTYQDREYTHKVTYVTTVAQTVQSVKADNLKQIVVTFDGTVDAESAENEDNYVIKDRSFHSATLSEDKSSVTLLLDNEAVGNHLSNQRETELEIKNVKNSDGTKTFSQKVKFTPSDVTAPTAKEVTGLGTKAFKIKFSEPIDPATAQTSSNYKVDGKAIGASVKFAFPDTVIVQTNLPVGDHTVSVSNVADFSGLKVAPVENSFTISEDTSAPEVVSAKTKDLKEVIIEFNETVKSVSEAQANSSSNKASRIVIEDTKVRLFFNNAINYSENTISLKAVTDYSDNKADREVKVTPTLDTVRPTVSDTELKLASNGHYIAKVRFSEDLHADSLNRDNFVLKNSEGKIADVAGINSNGHPTLKPTFDGSNKRVILVDLGSALKSEKYTLTISGVKDLAVVGNVIVPVTVDLDVAKAASGEIDRVWTSPADVGYNYVFIEFNKELATSGDGTYQSAAKYTLYKDGNLVGQLTDENSDIDLITAKTVRIRTKLTVTPAANSTEVFSVRASYIANSEGEYLKQNGGYDLTKNINTSNVVGIKSGSVKAISRTEVKVEFDSRISSVVDSDFRVNGSVVSASLAGDGKSVTLKLDDDNKLPANPAGLYLTTVPQTSIGTQNEYGIKLGATSGVGILIKDEIKPEYVSDSLKIASVASATTATYDIALSTTEVVEFNTAKHGTNVGIAQQMFEIEATQNNVKYKGTVTSIDYDEIIGLVLRVEFVKDSDGTAVANLGPNATFNFKFKGENEEAKYIIDENGNALKAFSDSIYYDQIPVYTP